MATETIKVNPEELKAAILQISNDIAGVSSEIGQVKFEISKNTCKNITEFKDEVTELTTNITSYIGKYEQNLSALTQKIVTVEELDKILANGVAANSSYDKAVQEQQNQNKGAGTNGE